jgi:hypothetical protein
VALNTSKPREFDLDDFLNDQMDELNEEKELVKKQEKTFEGTKIVLDSECARF